MGKKTTVATSISRVLPDDNLPNSIKTGVTKALFKNGELVDYVLEEMISGIGIKASRMYEYAKRGTYTFGLPSGQFTNGLDGLAQVQAALETLEGLPVVLDYSHYGPPNNLHIAWMKLIDEEGYSPETNELMALSAIKGTKVWLHDMIVRVNEAEYGDYDQFSLKQWGVAAKAGYTPNRPALTPAAAKLVLPTPIGLDPDTLNEYVRVEYCWLNASGVLLTDAFNIPIEGYDDAWDCFHVRYIVGGVARYWLYRDGEGTYPELDAVYDRQPIPNGSFFPFAYFRFNKQSEIEDTTTEAYKTSKKLVGYLGMDYDMVAEGVNANPDIDDVEQAIMMMAVPANTEDPIERRYLWKFFDNLYAATAAGAKFSSVTQADIATEYITHLGFQVEALHPNPGLVIQDTRFKMAIENDGVYKRRVAGSIGAVDEYTSGFTVTYRSETVDTMIPTGGGDYIAGTEVIQVPTKSHYFRKQVSTGFYDEIQVVELRTRFHIFGGYSTLGDELDKILLIPVDYSIARAFPIPDRETLYARSLHYVFNSVIITKIKWYQTGLFQVLLIIVAIVIFVYSGYDVYSPIYAALLAGNYVLATILIAELVATYLLTQLAFKYFVKLVGVENAFIIAIVLLVVTMGLVGQNGGLEGAPWAMELLQLSSGIAQGIGAELKDSFQDLLKDSDSLTLFMKEQTKLLDDAKKLLEGTNHLDPFVIFGESPEEFYNRTVHSGNIGVVGIDAISMYVDSALTLPKLKDTLGESI